MSDPIPLTKEQAQRFKLQVGLALADEASRDFVDGFTERVEALVGEIDEAAHAGIEEIFSALDNDNPKGAREEAHKLADSIILLLRGDDDDGT